MTYTIMSFLSRVGHAAGRTAMGVGKALQATGGVIRKALQTITPLVTKATQYAPVLGAGLKAIDAISEGALQGPFKGSQFGRDMLQLGGRALDAVNQGQVLSHLAKSDLVGQGVQGLGRVLQNRGMTYLS